MNTIRDTFRSLTGGQSSPNSAQESSQTSAQEKENNNSSSKLIEREHIKGTPFQIITLEQGSFIALGNRRLNEYTSKERCMEMIECQEWELLMNVIVSMYEIMTANKDTD